MSSSRHSRAGGNLESLITDNIDIWSSATQNKKGVGRGSSKKINLYGIKKLRELILELAVRGLLVPQDPNDEPVSILLEKISNEKEQLISDKKIKKTKKLPEITEQEKIYMLPLNWEWVRLNDIGDWGAGATPRRGNHELYGGKIPWFKSGELNADFISESEETVTEVALKQASLRYNKVGDVLIAMYGATIGKTAILNVPATTNQAVCACTPFSGIKNIFLLTLLKAYKPRFISMGAGGAQPNISREKLIATVISLPPLKEQHRIVTKVDELMTLCDQLEQQQENSITAHKTLVETLLSALTNAADKGALTAMDGGNTGNASLQGSNLLEQRRSSCRGAISGGTAWEIIANHFDTLFTTEHSIDQIKQTILQLAVMGKLVPQDPNDEPASALLRKIASEKERLIKEKKIKKQKALPEISDNEKPYELPDGWEWSKLGDVSILQGGFAYKSSLFVDDGKYQVIRMGNIRPDKFRLNQKAIFINSELANSTQEYEISSGDILLTMTGTKGKRDYLYSLLVDESHLTERRLYLNQRLCITRPIITYNHFINLLLKDDRLLDFVYAKSTGTANQANIGMEAIMNWVLPIPPLKEQSRIVDKVDELMILCDQLTLNVKDAQTIKLHLADVIAEQAVN